MVEDHTAANTKLSEAAASLAITLPSQPTPRALAEHGLRWAPYRTTASWYLWRYVDYVRERQRAGKDR